MKKEFIIVRPIHSSLSSESQPDKHNNIITLYNYRLNYVLFLHTFFRVVNRYSIVIRDVI